jgi:hypothetical protein
MSFTGKGRFKIINRTGTDIENVRVTHFLKGNDYIKDSELAIVEKLANEMSSDLFTFQSLGGKSDHWCVAFQNNKGCWQSYDLDKSMSDKFIEDGYELIIEENKFIFSAKNIKKGVETKDKKITSVFEAIKS